MNKKDPSISHRKLVGLGRPQLAVVQTAPKWVKNNSLCVIKLSIDGTTHAYFTSNKDVAHKFSKFVGESVTLIASGDQDRSTDTMEIQLAGVPASTLLNVPKASLTPETAPKVIEHKDREAKTFLCQAANLMRLCVKKANDIAVELGLPNEHRQGIATTLFIQADRHGFIAAMPISGYTPEQLGWGSSKANSPQDPQPETNE